MKGFGSDNHSGVHPLLLQSILDCNSFHEPSYGTDSYSAKTDVLFKNLFHQDTEVHYVYNGTAANVLSLRCAMKRHETVLCSDISHLHLDECGSPEFFAGKIQTLPTLNGKIIISEIENYLIRKGDQHYSQPRIISITQPTEVGTCYSIEEIKKISIIAQNHKMFLHIDGARLANSLFFLKTTFKKMLIETGVDIISMGGTKNGFAFGEAVIILNKTLQKDFKFIRKQSAQLPSKTRFIANQFWAYLNNDTYLKIAGHSVQMAELLYLKLSDISKKHPELIITQKQQSNAVFVIIPKEIIKTIRSHFFFYVWNEKNYECRLMTSWDTTAKEIDDFSGLMLDQLSL